MAQVLGRTRQDVEAKDWEVELAKKAATKVVFPEKSPQEMLEGLLQALSWEKRRRRLLGIDHWKREASVFIQGRIHQLHEERRALIDVFFRARHKRLLEYAWRITRNQNMAQEALSRTCVELLEGKTSLQYFVRALKMNARDALDRRVVERDRFMPLDILVASQFVPESEPLDEQYADDDAPDFPSNRKDDRDPLEILMEREELKSARNIARSDAQFRWIKQKRWSESAGLFRKVRERSVTKHPSSAE